VDADRPVVLAVYRSSVWSTRVDLVVTDPGLMVRATRLLEATLERVDAVASRFRSDSEINQLHRAADGVTPVVVSAELSEAIGVALRAARLTDGAVDPTVGAAMCRLGYDRDFSLVPADVAGTLPEPGPVPGWRSVVLDTERSTVTLPAGTVLDLGATAKAWASDRAARSIASRLGCGALVSLGGDIAVSGVAPEGGFAVGIADICGDPSAPTTVAIESGGLATSGVGNRHWSVGRHPVHHLLDPTTGLPVDTPWKTVSVAAGSCVDANTASTAAMVMGEAAIAWLSDARLPSRLVRRGGETVTVAGWPDEADEAHEAGEAHAGVVVRGSRASVAP
jgi:thiamine biosynthesis lipoprotein